MAEELGLRPLAAHCHRGLGELNQRVGKRRDALRHATIATTAYCELGMPSWRERADALVKALE